jgi:hypothetical protein
MKDVFLWSHIALIRAVNACIHSFLLPLIVYELSTQITTSVMKPKHDYEIVTQTVPQEIR